MIILIGLKDGLRPLQVSIEMAEQESLLLFLLFLLVANSGCTAVPLRALAARSYAALGDSYATGAGAGHLIFTPGAGFGCGHYSDAYPVQVANSTNLDIEEFKNLACGGMTSATVLREQVPHIGGSDVVSVTVSGNEVNFFVVLNECVYHWWPSSTCEAALAKARGLIESHVLWDNLQALVRGAREKLEADALLLVTGYARFFNDQTEICDHVTFSRTRPLDYLTKAKRKTLNQLVTMLNDVIRASAEVHGAVYVDIDTPFEGHRFCEEGVQEPDLGREKTWFFNLPSVETDEYVSEQMLLVQNQNLQENGKIKRLANGDFPNIETWRVFHPTSLGHRGIAMKITDEVLARTTAAK
jgi:hypothetical protein